MASEDVTSAAQLGVVALMTASLDRDLELVVEELDALVNEVGLPALHYAMFWTIGTLVGAVAHREGTSPACVVEALAGVIVDDGASGKSFVSDPSRQAVT